MYPRTRRQPWDHNFNGFPLKIAHGNRPQGQYLLKYLSLAEVPEVGVVEVHEGVLEGSDQPGTILKQFVSRFMDELDEVAEGVQEPLDQAL